MKFPYKLLFCFLAFILFAPSAQASVTWLRNPVEITMGATAAWVDVNLLAIVPTGTKGVVVRLFNDSANTNGLSVRENGSTDNRPSNIAATSQTDMWVGLDDNYIFEVYRGDADMNVYLVGYVDDDATFQANATVVTPTEDSTWRDVDITATTGGGALAAIVAIESATAAAYSALRMNGSTDTRVGYNTFLFSQTHQMGTFVVGVDGGEIYEGYASSNSIKHYLIGWFTANVTMLTNATDKSLGTTGSYVDLAALPTGATGGFFHLHSPGITTGNANIREEGSTIDLYQRNYFASFLNSGVDASLLAEGKIGGTDVDFYLQGYTTKEACTTGCVEQFISTDVWIAPASVTSAQIACWGGGGAGDVVSTSAGGGGGGGAFASSTVAVTPGSSYTITVGAGGVGGTSPTAGGDSTVVADDKTVLADGGTAGSAEANGTGGTVAGSTGDVENDGGNGADGLTTGDAGGGGGGAGGPAGDGGVAADASATVGGGGGGGNGGGAASGSTGGTAGSNAGAGGNGDTNDATSPGGVPGFNGGYGGGGGGGSDDGDPAGNGGFPGGGGGGGEIDGDPTEGGDGGSGMCIISYSVAAAPAVTEPGGVRFKGGVRIKGGTIIR